MIFSAGFEANLKGFSQTPSLPFWLCLVASLWAAPAMTLCKSSKPWDLSVGPQVEQYPADPLVVPRGTRRPAGGTGRPEDCTRGWYSWIRRYHPR